MKTAIVHAQQRWEYMYVNRKTELTLVDTMNELGAQGWEMVTATYYKDMKGLMCWTALMKRPSAGGPTKSAAEGAESKGEHAIAAPKFDVNGEVFDVQK